MGHRSKKWVLRGRLLSGEVEELLVRNHNKVSFVRSLVAQRLGVGASSVKLLVGDDIMDDWRALSWYDLSGGAEITIVLRTR
jgi:hypothetical protein